LEPGAFELWVDWIREFVHPHLGLIGFQQRHALIRAALNLRMHLRQLCFLRRLVLRYVALQVEIRKANFESGFSFDRL
jgi:hypothetical protein